MFNSIGVLLYMKITHFVISSFCILDDFFVTWGARTESGAPSVAAGAPLPPMGKPLGKLSSDDLVAVIERGLKIYSKSYELFFA